MTPVQEVVKDAAGGADSGLAIAGDVPGKTKARSPGQERHVVIPAVLLYPEASANMPLLMLPEPARWCPAYACDTISPVSGLIALRFAVAHD